MNLQHHSFAHGRAGLRALRCLACAGIGLLVACVLVLAPAANAHEPAAEVRTHSITDIDFTDVRDALVESIADEGIATPVVSHFADMLARTAGDLGHRPDLYADAEIFTSAAPQWQRAWPRRRAHTSRCVRSRLRCTRCPRHHARSPSPTVRPR